MTKKLLGRKRGMTQRFDETGNLTVCTIIEVEPNVVTQIKTVENDGYSAVQIGFLQIRAGDERTIERRAGKPLAGHFKKAGVAPRRFLTEYRCSSEETPELAAELDLSVFDGVEFVDVSGTSKGKGYAGLMKKYNYSGGPAAHGSGFHRHAGSTGNRSTPGRCFRGSPRPSHMGNEKVTVQSLKVVALEPEKNYLLVKGAVPGPNGGMVSLSPAVKKR